MSRFPNWYQPFSAVRLLRAFVQHSIDIKSTTLMHSPYFGRALLYPRHQLLDVLYLFVSLPLWSPWLTGVPIVGKKTMFRQTLL